MTSPVVASMSPFDHPALARCGKRFWAEMAKVAVPVPMADAQPYDNEFRRRLSIQRREAHLSTIPATVTLATVAEWVDLPPEYARGYLRAVHAQLEACGLLLLERRLGAHCALGGDVPYGGEYQAKNEKSALDRASREADQAEKAAAREHKLKLKELGRANRALTAAERRVARGKEGDDLDALNAAVARAQTAVDAAAEVLPALHERSGELAAQLANTQYLPLPRMGYAAIRNTAPNGAL